MTTREYLGSEQAAKEVAALLERAYSNDKLCTWLGDSPYPAAALPEGVVWDSRPRGGGVLSVPEGTSWRDWHLVDDAETAWLMVEFEETRAFFRPDGEHTFLVTDLGTALLARRLRTGYVVAVDPRPAEVFRFVLGDTKWRIIGDACCCLHVPARDLPRALCQILRTAHQGAALP